MAITLRRRALGATAFAAALPGIGRAQGAWPDRPVRLVVPFGAGGAVDTLSRTVANAFPQHANGQPMVVENRSGAGGTIAGAVVAQSRPDGYTLMMADLGANAIGKMLQPSLGYDPMTAFTPIIHLVNLPLVIVTRPGLEAATLPELIDLAKRRNGEMTYASPGVGHASHLSAELLARRAGIRWTAVHYRSGADVMRSVIAGETDWTFPSVSTSLPFIRENRVKTIAVSTANPVPLLPGVPPVAATYAGFNSATWHGVVGPAGMAPELVNQANAALRAIITTPAIKEQTERVQAAEIVAGTPADFAAFIKAEAEKWEPVIREGNIRAE
ncbi:tripartite tricarboxylate transporter substrate binding protein [Roseomonas sp. JC162]|uniref:Tripartite tricarboxylate transporter substrate binding protein n=1 Tax=Neoroseomonas marina TaxID=1232220 RepID=A0A848E7U2_9PROT|nr:tripartite tricarboxylate transporter substrate-binding protein [Neoroseomonas marina]NMJ39667.1 tripartite tricarboxylate transporter substrate binding protein [Neoroseomonas marina]